MEIIGLLTEEPLVTLAVKNKIKNFITTDLYRDLDEFIKDNPTFEDFKQHAKSNELYRRALNCSPNTITEDDYQQILSELRAELEEKMRIEKEKINTVYVNGKEISTYKTDDGSVITVDNSYSKKTIPEQLEDIQKKYSRFRQNGDKNTIELMEYIEEEIKPEPNFQDVDDLSTSSLTQEDREKAAVAQAYQTSTDNEVTVNLEDGLILDNDKILEIHQNDTGYTVTAPNQVNGEMETEDTTLKKSPQKTLIKQPLKQAGFSDAILLALLTGMFIGLVVLNIYIRAI